MTGQVRFCSCTTLSGLVGMRLSCNFVNVCNTQLVNVYRPTKRLYEYGEKNDDDFHLVLSYYITI